MRMVVQRVTRAAVEVDGQIVGQIGQGLLVYLGVGHDDTEKDCEFIADKIAHLRIFEDDQGKMNRSVLDIGGAVLLVSQFTLYGDCRKGRRPGFDAAGDPARADQLYREVIRRVQQLGVPVEQGRFAAHMKVSSVNDGPVTFMLDSSRIF